MWGAVAFSCTTATICSFEGDIVRRRRRRRRQWATSLPSDFAEYLRLATVESFKRASGGQDLYVTWIFEQKVT